uniref:Uncharacterized protein n=1 Tax=Siphoviridae sp. ctWT735 TaxID=2825538 RepID=A0A8S5TU71_9CAUD|nr:MAG TPA: hypothetical protein [Siphoviridae sp. ctWT735]
MIFFWGGYRSWLSRWLLRLWHRKIFMSLNER